MKVGEAIRLFRERAGLTQKELAEAIGVTASNVGQIEGGYIAMRSDLIGKLKRQYPDLWKELSAIRLQEERAALGLENDQIVNADESATLAVLKSIRAEIDHEIERRQKPPISRKKEVKTR